MLLIEKVKENNFVQILQKVLFAFFSILNDENYNLFIFLGKLLFIIKEKIQFIDLNLKNQIFFNSFNFGKFPKINKNQFQIFLNRIYICKNVR